MADAVDLVVIPFHDWRKVQREGTRTRDAHLIKRCIAHPGVGRVVIVNRPMSLPEMIYKRAKWRTEGTLMAAKHNSQLVQIDERAYVIDFRAGDLITPVLKRKNWFFSAYIKTGFLKAIDKYLRRLNITEFDTISFSIFAAALSEQLGGRRKAFDAWDNFLRFAGHERYYEGFRQAYRSYAEHCDFWSTNSVSNQEFYEAEFGVKDCQLIRNGVDIKLFGQRHEVPHDLKSLPRPLAGVGAKITHLLDTDLINRMVASNPDVTFVLVGQKLNKDIFKRIRKAKNFHYLGDKSYHDYIAYVRAFDVCLIPYVVGDREHGQDTIKFYEYLAADRPIVTTANEGITDEYENVFVAADHEEFCAMIPRALAAPPVKNDLSETLTWRHKADQLLAPLLP